jgi:type I restriction enzyme, S subunit
LPFTTVAEDRVMSPKHRFHAGQILYSKIRPYLAKVVVVEFEGVCSADMYPINAFINARYLHKWMLTTEFTNMASQHQGRTVLPKINSDALVRLPVPVPPLAEQHRIVAEVERRLSVVQELEGTLAANLARAERLRQSILKRAFEGKLVM